jgi:hypothetical protein
MAQRQNVPGNRTPATLDANPQKHFQQMQRLGYIPLEYNSWDELEGMFLDLTVREGMSDKEAAKVMGVDYTNVIGKGYLKVETSSTGKVRGLDKRSIREDIKPDEEVVLRQTLGDDGFKRYQRWRQLQWGDAKPTKNDAAIIQEFSGKDPANFLSTKVEADQVRDRLHISFGKGGKGAEVHRGHGTSALKGASVGATNLWPEWGPLNVGHGSDPRYAEEVMRSNNMSANDLQNYFDDILDKAGLNINPAAYYGTGLAADESLRELSRPEVTGRNNSTGNPQISAPVEPGSVSQDSIEWRNRRLYEHEQQIAADAMRNGADEQTARALARQRVQELAYNQSGLADTTQSVGGPVRQVQPPRPAPQRVGTVDSGPAHDSAGRPKFDRAGNPKRETRPLVQGQIGTIPKTNPAPPTGTLRYQKPAPAPAPIPKPAAKPVATPKPAAKPVATPKPAAKPVATPKPVAKPSDRLRATNRGTGSGRTGVIGPNQIAPPSTERHGPFGMIGTIDTLHERQHTWQR